MLSVCVCACITLVVAFYVLLFRMIPKYTKSIPTIIPKCIQSVYYVVNILISLYYQFNNFFVKPFPCEPFSDSLNCSLNGPMIFCFTNQPYNLSGNVVLQIKMLKQPTA